MHPYDFPPARRMFQTLILIVVLLLVDPVTVDASRLQHHAAAASTRVTIVFGQEDGEYTAVQRHHCSNGTIKSTGPIRLTGNAATGFQRRRFRACCAG